jgi:hypothetical protein
MPRKFGLKFREPTASMSLVWITGGTDPRPQFTLSGIYDLQLLDVLRVNIASANYDNTVQAEELATLEFDYVTGALPNGSYTATAYHRRNSANIRQSAGVSVVINDSVAPVLSSPTDVKTDYATATGTVSTTKDTGNLWWVLSSSTTPPSAAQVKAGQMHTGAAAIASGSQPVTATGTQTVNFTGLNPSTFHCAHYMHEDIAPNQSSVSSGDGFTTDSSSPFTYAGYAVDNRTFDQPTSSHNIDFGSVSGTKTAVIGVVTYTTVISGVTVDGNAATLVRQTASGLGSHAALYRYDITTGGVKTIVVTGSSNLADTAVAAGYLSGLTATETATDLFAPGFRNSPQVMFDGSSGNGVGTQAIPSSGAGVGISYSEDNAVAIVVSNATQHCDENTGGASGPKRVAFYSLSLDADPSIAFDPFGGDGHVMAAWGP